MNQIDQKFYELMDVIRPLSFETVVENTKKSFLQLMPEMQKVLEDYFKKYPYWGKLDIKNQEYEHFKLTATLFKDHSEELQWLYQNLNDYRSKKVLYSVLKNWYQYDMTVLEPCQEKNYNHYFDLDLVSCQNEVFVDLGAYIGDTIFDYIHNYGEKSYQKIYAYEISDDILPYLKKNTEHLPNIEIRNKAVTNQNETLYLSENTNDSSANSVMEQGSKPIEAVSLDEDIEEEITTIKMDIEGSEQKALMGAKNHIRKNHPKLLISVYHNLEDIWKIPKMIEEMSENTYQYYLRYYGGSVYPTEIILIAIPKK